MLYIDTTVIGCNHESHITHHAPALVDLNVDDADVVSKGKHMCPFVARAMQRAGTNTCCWDFSCNTTSRYRVTYCCTGCFRCCILHPVSLRRRGEPGMHLLREGSPVRTVGEKIARTCIGCCGRSCLCLCRSTNGSVFCCSLCCY